MTNYRRRRTPQRNNHKRYFVNERIRANEVRLIDEEGNMLGIMSLQEAINMADEKELDVIEINPKAQPVICKLMSFSKFKYLQSKNDTSKNNKKQIKTLRVSVRVSPHDLLVRARKAEGFMEKGMKVKLQVQMRGREKAHPEVAEETIHKFIEMIEAPFEYENEPKRMGDSYYSTIKPGKKS